LSKKDKKHVQGTLDYFGREQMDEFDWAEQEEGWNLMTDAGLEAHARATELISNFSEEMENATVEIENPPGSGQMEKVPLFDKDDIANELYTPLVREGLLPETFVPDDFSRTKKQIEGAFGEYRERLEEEGFSKLAVVGEYAKFGLTLASSGAQMAGSVATFKDAANLKPEDVQWSKFGVFQKGSDDTDWIKKLGKKGETDLKEFSDIIGKGIDFVKDIGVPGAEAVYDKLEKKYQDSNRVMEPGDRRALMASRIADSMITAVSVVISEQFAAWDLAMVASTVFRSGAEAKPIITLLQSDKASLEKADGQLIVNSLAAGFGTILSFCPADGGIAAKATTKITSDFKKTDADLLVAKINGDDYTGAMDVVAKSASSAIASIVSDNEFSQFMVDHKGEILNALGQKMADDFTNRLAEVEREQELDWEKCKKDPSKNLSLIEKKIKEIEKRRAALKWAKSISSMGVAVAAKFFAPLAIAGSAINLAENLTECVIRVRDSLNFIESGIDFSRDASAFTAPIANFIHNAEVQAIHFEIRATCDLINMIGAIVETAGYASGPGAAIGVVVGKTMQATATATSALEGVMYEIAKKVEARIGWSKYKEALLKPENRKLALIAMKKNPTLAKYAVAWGAIIEKDVLVEDFLGKTGLTVETLRDPKANVGLVVTYLEARMPEDNIVVGMESVAKDWAPAPQLTLECWSAAIRRGQEKAKLVVEGSESSIERVEFAILAHARIWNSIKSVPKGQAPATKDIDACKETIRELASSLSGYRPKRKLSSSKVIEHAEMKEFLGSMRGLADVRIEWLDEKGWEKAK
jgi:hypothetical protein